MDLGKRCRAYAVYLIENQSSHCRARHGNDVIKIGISHDPRGRLAALATGSPDRLELISVTWFAHHDVARAVEQQTHRLIAERRISGEWFAANKSKAEEMVRAVADLLRVNWETTAQMLTRNNRQKQL